MTYENYRMVFLAGAILTGIFLLAAVVLFFCLRIPAVIGDLTGYTARKAIKQIRAGNETGRTGQKPDPKPAFEQRIQDRMTDRLDPFWRENGVTEEIGMAAAPFRIEAEITYIHTAETIDEPSMFFQKGLHHEDGRNEKDASDTGAGIDAGADYCGNSPAGRTGAGGG